MKKETDLPAETKYHFAKVCLNNQYFEKAANICDDLLEEDYEQAHRVLATISKETKNYPKMVLHLKKSIEAEPESLLSWHELSEHLIETEDYEAAGPILVDGLNLFPDDSVLQYFKGVLDFVLQNYEEAIEHFKIALAHFDGQSFVKISKEDILKKLVKAYYKTANYSALVDCTSLHLQTYPDAVYLQKYYALGLLQTGGRDEGVELLAQLIRNGEDSGLVLESYLQFAEKIEMNLHAQLLAHLKKINVFDLQMHYTEVLIENERYSAALEVLQLEKKHLQTVQVIKNILLCAFKLNRKDLIDAYIDAKVDFETLRFNEVQDFVNLYAQAGKHHRVLDLLLMAEEPEEKSVSFVLWYAKSLRSIGRSQNAVDALQELLNTGKRGVAIYTLLGKLYFDLEDKLNGLVAFDDAIECDDVQAMHMKEIADFFSEEKDQLNQIRFLKEALRLSASADLYYELACVYQGLQNPYEALNSLQLGLGIHAGHLDSLVLQTVLLKELGHLNAALASIEKAIQVAPQNEHYYAILAEINLLLGNFDEAYVQIPILEKINSVESEMLIGQLNFFSLHFENVLGQKFDSGYAREYEAMQIFSALLLDRDEEVMILLNQHLSNMDTGFDFYALQTIYLAKKGDLVAAQQSFVQGLESFENNVDAIKSMLYRYLSSIYFAVAAAWLQDWNLVSELFAKANEIYPAVMVQNYLMILVKMMARFVTPIYEALDVKSHAKASLPYLKHYDLEIHRLQSIQLKCINTQQVNILFVLNSLMSGQDKPIESLQNEFEVCAFLLGNPKTESVIRLFEMKSFGVLSKLLAGALFESKAVTFADAMIDSLTGMLGKNALVNAMVAKNLEKNGALLDALKIWEGATKIWDQEPKWLGRYAKLLVKVGMLEQASNAFEKGLAIDASNVEMTLALGDLHAMQNSFGDASEHYANAVQKGMNDERVFAAYSKSLQKIDKPVLAEKMAIRAIEADPNSVESVLNYAEILAANADYRRATVALNKAKSMAGEDANVLAFEVKLLDQQGKFGEAIEILNAQQTTQKLSKDMKIRHASLYAKSGNAGNSIAILESMMQENASDTDVALALFKLYLEQENYEKALQYGQVTLQNVNQSLSASDVVVLYEELAKILHSKGQLDQAVHYLDEAISIAPNKASLYLEIAQVFVQSRQYERAINYLQESTRLGIHNVEICVLAADLFEKSMDFIHAEEMLKKASELEPKNVEIKRKLKNVIVRKIVGQRGE
jgi:tetratricopeptide (TPR) repeat protein